MKIDAVCSHGLCSYLHIWTLGFSPLQVPVPPKQGESSVAVAGFGLVRHGADEGSRDVSHERERKTAKHAVSEPGVSTRRAHVHRVSPDESVDLSALPADVDLGVCSTEWRARSRASHEQLITLQERLLAERRRRCLVILQAMDAGGKDGVIRHLFTGLDPHGARAIAFKKPTTREVSRDFLWRVHRHVPADGELVVFNRSHFEDVLACGIEEAPDVLLLERRIRHVNDFERMLFEEGTCLVKLFLHIDRAEQAARLEARPRRSESPLEARPSGPH